LIVAHGCSSLPVPVASLPFVETKNYVADAEAAPMPNSMTALSVPSNVFRIFRPPDVLVEGLLSSMRRHLSPVRPLVLAAAAEVMKHSSSSFAVGVHHEAQVIV